MSRWTRFVRIVGTRVEAPPRADRDHATTTTAGASPGTARGGPPGWAAPKPCPAPWGGAPGAELVPPTEDGAPSAGPRADSRAYAWYCQRTSLRHRPDANFTQPHHNFRDHTTTPQPHHDPPATPRPPSHTTTPQPHHDPPATPRPPSHTTTPQPHHDPPATPRPPSHTTTPQPHHDPPATPRPPSHTTTPQPHHDPPATPRPPSHTTTPQPHHDPPATPRPPSHTTTPQPHHDPPATPRLRNSTTPPPAAPQPHASALQIHAKRHRIDYDVVGLLGS